VKHWLTMIAAIALLESLAVPVMADEVHFVPSIAVIEEYNDNLFFDKEDAVEDWITTLIGGIAWSSRSERYELTLKGTVAPFFYQDQSDFDEVDLDCLAGFGYRLTPRWQLRTDGFFRIDNRPDRDLETSGLIFGSNERRSYHGQASTQYIVHENHTATLSYSYDQHDWKDGAQRQDYHGHALDFLYSYDIGRWFRATQLLLNAGYGRHEYDTSRIDAVYATFGMQRMLDEVLRLKVSGGARYMDSRFDVGVVGPPPATITETSQTWGGIGSIGIDYLGERTKCSLTLLHDLRTAGSRTGASDLTRLLLDLRYLIQEKFAIGLFTGYYLNRTDAGDYSTLEQEEDTFSVRPFLRWQIHRNFYIEGSYQYTRVADKETDVSIARHRALCQLRFEYDVMD